MALWSKDKLRARAARAAEADAELGPAAQAALAWARWQGMTDEGGLDRSAQKAELDRLVDAMEPEQWRTLYDKLGDSGNAAVRGVLQYSAARGAEEMAQALENVKQVYTDQAEDPPVEPETAPEAAPDHDEPGEDGPGPGRRRRM